MSPGGPGPPGPGGRGDGHQMGATGLQPPHGGTDSPPLSRARAQLEPLCMNFEPEKQQSYKEINQTSRAMMNRTRRFARRRPWKVN